MIAPLTPEPEDDPIDHGGLGGEFIDPRTTASDLRMIRRAIANGYPIREELRKSLVEEMESLMLDSEDERVKVAAAKTLLTADAINVKLESLDQADKHHEEGESLTVYHDSDAIRLRLAELCAAGLERQRIEGGFPTAPEANGNGHATEH